jgi:hypothetical protein
VELLPHWGFVHVVGVPRRKRRVGDEVMDGGGCGVGW